MNKKLCAMLLSSALLTGCISPTTYHPYNGRDGFEQVQLNDTLCEVRFTGNSVTPKDQVHNMMLYRAAEMTQSNHRAYFQVLSEKTERQKQSFTEAGHSDTYVQKGDGYKQSSTSYTPPSTFVETSYTTVIRFRMLTKGSDETNVYNAATLKDSLGPQIRWPKPDNN